VISGKELNAIFESTKSLQVTVFSYLVSALNLRLCHYCDQEDILIGTAGANRNYPQLSNMMGFFVNIFPIRSDLSSDPTIEQLIRRIHICSNEAISNQNLSFDRLVDKLKIEREPDRTPLFQLLFVMQDTADNVTLKLEDCLVEEKEILLDNSIFDITFNVYKTSEMIKLTCQYNTDLFSK